MPCGKRPLVKLWDKPRIISNVKPSKYEQKEASVKLHWRNVIRNLEASRKEDNVSVVITVTNLSLSNQAVGCASKAVGSR